ncbi:unnamed protein product [Moneuplotes crassus]|uniref:Ras-related protein Rab-7b n=2 Tax=Euplotes crassus TaxID=5936 RepID=A0AAD2D5H0_EUPCR|nr:unnamed protein product [Moneuplotes crassus]
MEKKKNKKVFLKVVIIGDSGVGKTSLIHRYTSTRFLQDFKPTIGAEFSNKEVVINGQTVVAQIWDTAGQERYQSLGISFYRGADCCGIVFDRSEPGSFENLETWKNAFLKHGAPKEEGTFPFLVIGNKSDLDDGTLVKEREAQEWCSSNGNLEYIETSAKDNTSVEEAFTKLIEKGMEREKVNLVELPDRMSQKNKTVNLERDVAKEVNRKSQKKKCC